MKSGSLGSFCPLCSDVLGACAFAWAYFIHIAGHLVAPFNLSLAVLQFYPSTKNAKQNQKTLWVYPLKENHFIDILVGLEIEHY